MKIFTIGFTQKRAETFFDLLQQNGVQRVVDIRLNPGGQLSRFAKQEDLPYSLARLADGCQYVHMPELAPTKEILDDYRAKSDEALLGELMQVLKLCAGDEGARAVVWFAKANGAKYVHGPDSPLSKMAQETRQFVTSYHTLLIRVREGVSKLAAGGKVPDSASSLQTSSRSSTCCVRFTRRRPTTVTLARTTRKSPGKRPTRSRTCAAL